VAAIPGNSTGMLCCGTSQKLFLVGKNGYAMALPNFSNCKTLWQLLSTCFDPHGWSMGSIMPSWHCCFVSQRHLYTFKPNVWRPSATCKLSSLHNVSIWLRSRCLVPKSAPFRFVPIFSSCKSPLWTRCCNHRYDPKLPRSFVLELAAPIWDSSLLEAQSASLKMRLAALFWGWQPHSEASWKGLPASFWSF
jgi:hypothetical protein